MKQMRFQISFSVLLFDITKKFKEGFIKVAYLLIFFIMICNSAFGDAGSGKTKGNITDTEFFKRDYRITRAPDL